MTTHVLILDEDLAEGTRVADLLSGGNAGPFRTHCVDDPERAVASVLEGGIEVCVVAHRPGSGTLRAFARALEAHGARAPIVVLADEVEGAGDARSLAPRAADVLPWAAVSPLLLERSVLLAAEGARRQTEAAERKATERALTERVKELDARNVTGHLINNRELALDDRLRRIVEAIPSGWTRPDLTEARITLDGRTFATRGFRDTPWMQRATIPVGEYGGVLEVALTGEIPEQDGGPFLAEEHDLIESLGRIIGDGLVRERLTQLLSRTFASLEEAVVVLDSIGPDRRIRYVNPAAERIFGLPRDELVGSTPEQAHPDPGSYERFGREAGPVLDAGGTFRARFPLRRNDGTTFHAEQTVSLLDPERGPEGGVVSIIRDVSHAVRQEAALRESEGRFRQLAEHIQDVFWITSSGRERVEYVSPAYEAIWGRPREELYADPESWSLAIVPEDRARVRSNVERQREGGYVEDYRIVRPDGQERWIHDRAFPVFDEGGTLVRIVGVAEDVTERRLTEERFRVLGEVVSDVTYVVGRDGRILLSSGAVEPMTGYSTREVVGTDALRVVHPDDRPRIEEALAALAGEPGASGRIEYRIIRKDGRVREVESVARNLLEHPAIGGVVVTTRDIGERLTLERQLRQAQKMEAVGRLAGGIAHDFNNILTVIRSQTELLLLDGPDPETAEDLEVVRSAADRAATLTSQLLAFGREQVLQPRLVDVASVVRNLSAMIDRVVGAGVEVRYELSAPLERVLVDPDHLEQVVLNLVVNARDAMPDGGTLVIRTGMENLDPAAIEDLPGLLPGRYAVLAVRDDGVGMGPDTLSRIFDPFFTTKPRDKGTGLGLAMAYGFMKQTGGGIHVDSAPEGGSTFRLRFPVPPAGHEPPPTPPPAGPGARETGDDQEVRGADPTDGLQGAHAAVGSVLLVEDDPNVRRVTVRVLERAGFHVRATSHAEEAIEAIDSNTPFDLLVTDLVLPGDSGRSLVDRLSETRPGIPALVMSGYAEEAMEEGHRLPAGATYLQKPFTADEFLAAVRGTLIRGRAPN